MPLYEYECRSCGNRFEKLRKFSDVPLTQCPKCKKETVEQLISAPAIQFKGSGWYVTDYTKSNSSTAASAPANSGMEVAAGKESKATASESSSSTAKNESPSAAKAKSKPAAAVSTGSAKAAD